MANAASSTSVQSTLTQSTPTRTREQALIGAHNAAGLAQAYLEKGSYHAAKRKIIAALRDIELLTKEGEVVA